EPARTAGGRGSCDRDARDGAGDEQRPSGIALAGSCGSTIRAPADEAGNPRAPGLRRATPRPARARPPACDLPPPRAAPQPGGGPDGAGRAVVGTWLNICGSGGAPSFPLCTTPRTTREKTRARGARGFKSGCMPLPGYRGGEGPVRETPVDARVPWAGSEPPP